MLPCSDGKDEFATADGASLVDKSTHLGSQDLTPIVAAVGERYQAWINVEGIVLLAMLAVGGRSVGIEWYSTTAGMSPSVVSTGRDIIPFCAEHPAALLHRHDIHSKHEDAEVAHEIFSVRSVSAR